MAQQKRYFNASEVAMLVLGYLKENNLNKSLTTLLSESKDLSTYWQCLKSGINPDLNICGYNLISILEEFASFKLLRSAEGMPILKPGERSCILSQADIENSEDKIQQQLKKKEQQKIKDKIRNYVYRERLKERKELKKPSCPAAVATWRKTKRNSKPGTAECAVQTSNESERVSAGVPPENSYAESAGDDEIRPGRDLLQEAVSESGIREEMRDCSKDKQEERAGSASSAVDRGSAQSRGSDVDLEFLDTLLEQTHLPERLAAYINQGLGADAQEQETEAVDCLTCDEKRGRLPHTSRASTAAGPSRATGSQVGKELNLTNIIDQATSDPVFQDFMSLVHRVNPSAHLDASAEFSLPEFDDNMETLPPHSESGHSLKETVSFADNPNVNTIGEGETIKQHSSVIDQNHMSEKFQLATDRILQKSVEHGNTEKRKKTSPPLHGESCPVIQNSRQEILNSDVSENTTECALQVQAEQNTLQVGLEQNPPSLSNSLEKAVGTDQTCKADIAQSKHCLVPTAEGDKKSEDERSHIARPLFVDADESSVSVFTLLEREAAKLLGKKFTQGKQGDEELAVGGRMTVMSFRNLLTDSQPRPVTPETPSSCRRRKKANPKKSSLVFSDCFSNRQSGKASGNLGPKQSIKNVPLRPPKSDCRIENIKQKSRDNDACPSYPLKNPDSSIEVVSYKSMERVGKKVATNPNSGFHPSPMSSGSSLLSNKVVIARCPNEHSTEPSTSPTSQSLATTAAPVAASNDHSPIRCVKMENDVTENKGTVSIKESLSPIKESLSPSHATQQDLNIQQPSLSVVNLEMVDKCLIETLTPLVHNLENRSSSPNVGEALSRVPSERSSKNQDVRNLYMSASNLASRRQQFLLRDCNSLCRLNNETYSNALMPSNLKNSKAPRPHSCPTFCSEHQESKLSETESAESRNHKQMVPGTFSCCSNIGRSKSLPMFFREVDESEGFQVSHQTPNSLPSSKTMSVKPQSGEAAAKTVIAFHSDQSAFTPEHCCKPPTRRIAPREVSCDVPSPLQDSPFSPLHSAAAANSLMSPPTSYTPAPESLAFGSSCVTLGSPPAVRQAEADSNSPGKLRPEGAFSTNSLPARFRDKSGSVGRETPTKLAFRPVHTSNSSAARSWTRQTTCSKKTVITFHSKDSAFAPTHYQRRPSRRIAPTEVHSDTPSPLHNPQCNPVIFPVIQTSPAAAVTSSPNTPAAADMPPPDSTFSSAVEKDLGLPDMSDVGKPVKPGAENSSASSSSSSLEGAERAGNSKAATAKPGLLLRRLDSLGIPLPPSPSKRLPRRISLTQLTSISTQNPSHVEGPSRKISTAMSSPSLLLDESKIVSSSTDLSASQSEAQAFKLLKSFIASSYVRPQPQQEITSTNQGYLTDTDFSGHKKKRLKKSIPRISKDVTVEDVGSAENMTVCAEKQTLTSDEKVVGQTSQCSASVRTGVNNESGAVQLKSAGRMHSLVETAAPIQVPPVALLSSDNIQAVKDREKCPAADNERQVKLSRTDSPASGSSSASSHLFAVVGTVEYRGNTLPFPKSGSGERSTKAAPVSSITSHCVGQLAQPVNDSGDGSAAFSSFSHQDASSHVAKMSSASSPKAYSLPLSSSCPTNTVSSSSMSHTGALHRKQISLLPLPLDVLGCSKALKEDNKNREAHSRGAGDEMGEVQTHVGVTSKGLAQTLKSTPPQCSLPEPSPQSCTTTDDSPHKRLARKERNKVPRSQGKFNMQRSDALVSLLPALTKQVDKEEEELAAKHAEELRLQEVSAALQYQRILPKPPEGNNSDIQKPDRALRSQPPVNSTSSPFSPPLTPTVAQESLAFQSCLQAPISPGAIQTPPAQLCVQPPDMTMNNSLTKNTAVQGSAVTATTVTQVVDRTLRSLPPESKICTADYELTIQSTNTMPSSTLDNQSFSILPRNSASDQPFSNQSNHQTQVPSFVSDADLSPSCTQALPKAEWDSPERLPKKCYGRAAGNKVADRRQQRFELSEYEKSLRERRSKPQGAGGKFIAKANPVHKRKSKAGNVNLGLDSEQPEPIKACLTSEDQREEKLEEANTHFPAQEKDDHESHLPSKAETTCPDISLSGTLKPLKRTRVARKLKLGKGKKQPSELKSGNDSDNGVGSSEVFKLSATDSVMGSIESEILSSDQFNCADPVSSRSAKSNRLNSRIKSPKNIFSSFETFDETTSSGQKLGTCDSTSKNKNIVQIAQKTKTKENKLSVSSNCERLPSGPGRCKVNSKTPNSNSEQLNVLGQDKCFILNGTEQKSLNVIQTVPAPVDEIKTSESCNFSNMTLIDAVQVADLSNENPLSKKKNSKSAPRKRMKHCSTVQISDISDEYSSPEKKKARDSSTKKSKQSFRPGSVKISPMLFCGRKKEKSRQKEKSDRNPALQIRKYSTWIKDVDLSDDVADIECIVRVSSLDKPCEKNAPLNLSFESRNCLSSPESPMLTIDVPEGDQLSKSPSRTRLRGRGKTGRKHQSRNAPASPSLEDMERMKHAFTDSGAPCDASQKKAVSCQSMKKSAKQNMQSKMGKIENLEQRNSTELEENGGEPCGMVDLLAVLRPLTLPGSTYPCNDTNNENQKTGERVRCRYVKTLPSQKLFLESPEVRQSTLLEASRTSENQDSVSPPKKRKRACLTSSRSQKPSQRSNENNLAQDTARATCSYSKKQSTHSPSIKKPKKADKKQKRNVQRGKGLRAATSTETDNNDFQNLESADLVKSAGKRSSDPIRAGVSPTHEESRDKQRELEDAVAALVGCLAAEDERHTDASGTRLQPYVSPVKHLPLKKRHSFDLPGFTETSSNNSVSLSAAQSVPASDKKDLLFFMDSCDDQANERSPVKTYEPGINHTGQLPASQSKDLWTLNAIDKKLLSSQPSMNTSPPSIQTKLHSTHGDSLSVPDVPDPVTGLLLHEPGLSAKASNRLCPEPPSLAEGKQYPLRARDGLMQNESEPWPLSPQARSTPRPSTELSDWEPEKQRTQASSQPLTLASSSAPITPDQVKQPSQCNLSSDSSISSKDTGPSHGIDLKKITPDKIQALMHKLYGKKGSHQTSTKR